MQMISDAFRDGEMIPAKYTCDGENISPSLYITDVPQETKSLAIIVDDPDATGGKTFTHWTIWNIPPETKEIKEGIVTPSAVEGKTDFGKIGYGGPCPPESGPPHRYFFKLYALNSMLIIPKGSSREVLEESMRGSIIDKAEHIGLYGR